MRSFLCLIYMYFHRFCVAKDTVPVFLIDYDKILKGLPHEINPFDKTAPLEFTQIIENAMKKKSVFLIFIEDEFSSEDVSAKDEDGTPFKNLQVGFKRDKVKYLPNVHDPLALLIRLMKPSESNMFILEPGQQLQLPEGLQYYYIFFKDATVNEARVRTLRRHDLIMYEIYVETRKISGAAIAIYTGKYNPIVPENDYGVMAFKSRIYDTNQAVIVASDSALFRFVGMNLEMATRTRRMEYIEAPIVSSELRSVTHTGAEVLRTSIDYQGFEIKFSFRLSKEFWTLDNVTLLDGGEDMGATALGIRVPIGNSYYCNEPLIILNENDKSYISIPEYQIQPFKTARRQNDAALETLAENSTTTGNQNGTQNATFSDAVKCNPYFDIPILTGLFVSAILLSILLVGISFLFNCKTNSHYDDPRAKTIVVAASD